LSKAHNFISAAGKWRVRREPFAGISRHSASLLELRTAFDHGVRIHIKAKGDLMRLARRFRGAQQFSRISSGQLRRTFKGGKLHAEGKMCPTRHRPRKRKKKNEKKKNKKKKRRKQKGRAAP